MKPYYDRNGITIYHGDCSEVMKQFEDKSFDLVLTDPPYGINISKNGTIGKSQPFGKIDWDNTIPPEQSFLEMKRVGKYHIIWGGNYFLEYLNNTKCMLIWYKRDGLPKRTYADCEIAWTSFNRISKVYNIRWDGFIRDSKEKKVKHPTQKPIKLMERCINDFSEKGDIILDPFLGSGTTLVAARELGRKAVGIEISKKYCDIAVRRCNDVCSVNDWW